MPCAIYPKNALGSASVWSIWYQTVGRDWPRIKSAMRVVLPQPASAATRVTGDCRFASSALVSLGLGNRSETARGGISLVRRKRLGGCIDEGDAPKIITQRR